MDSPSAELSVVPPENPLPQGKPPVAASEEGTLEIAQGSQSSPDIATMVATEEKTISQFPPVVPEVANLPAPVVDNLGGSSGSPTREPVDKGGEPEKVKVTSKGEVPSIEPLKLPESEEVITNKIPTSKPEDPSVSAPASEECKVAKDEPSLIAKEETLSHETPNVPMEEEKEKPLETEEQVTNITTIPAKNRHPELVREVVHECFAKDCVASDPASSMQLLVPNPTAISRCTGTSFSYCNTAALQLVQSTLIWQAVLEEVEAVWYQQSNNTGAAAAAAATTNDSSEFVLPVAFTPAVLMQRIKAGCVLQHKTNKTGTGAVSARLAAAAAAASAAVAPATSLLRAKFGGRVALSLLDEQLEIPAAQNPYFYLNIEILREWLGKTGPKQWSAAELQDMFVSGQAAISAHDLLLLPTDRLVWSKLIATTKSAIAATINSDRAQDAALELFGPDARDCRIVLEPLHADADLEELASFARTLFTVRIVNESLSGRIRQHLLDTAAASAAAKKEKDAWESYRHKSIHTGYCHWPSWLASIPQASPTTSSSTANAMDDLALAQTLQEEAGGTGARTSRRRGAVFYGNQSNMTLKQLMDSCLRLSSQQPQTLKGLLQQDGGSSDPMRRIRTALGRLVYKRNQLAVKRVVVEETPFVATTAHHAQQYLQSLITTELQLRRMVVRCLTYLPVTLVATAADDRPGSMDNMDAIYFDDPDGIEWLTSGHALLGQRIFRPETIGATSELTPCAWFRVQDYVPSVASSASADETTGEIGTAKEPVAVERRMRFRVISDSNPPHFLILTEAQVRSGVMAGDIDRKSIQQQLREQPTEHPFTSGEISLYSSTSGETTAAIVVGHDTVAVNNQIQYKIFLLPKKGASQPPSRDNAFWATLESPNGGGYSCTVDGSGEEYKIQQFDYHPSSPAYQECLQIVKFLQRHPKGLVFQEPVDPILLKIPSYPTIVKHPMDVSTLSQKLKRGDYSNIPPGHMKGQKPVVRMLNGPFRRDVELIFDNAMLFNPPDDWIYKTAGTVKKSVIKKIEQASAAEGSTVSSGRPGKQQSVYVDFDSDVDMYVYESDQDDEYDTSQKKRKRRGSTKPPAKEDTSVRVIERAVRLQKVLSESMGLRGPFSNLPVNYNASEFSLAQEWSCRYAESIEHPQLVPAEETNKGHEEELDELLSLHRQVEDSELSGLRRSTRAAEQQDSGQANDSSSGPGGVEYFLSEVTEATEPIKTRFEVELARERLHETYFARQFHSNSKNLDQDGSLVGRYIDGLFPPFLGRVVPEQPSSSDSMSWEIREPLVLPALRWVIRGLIHSEHLAELEVGDSMASSVIVANNVYYIDEDQEPYDILDAKELTRRKRANDAEEKSSEDEVELSEYEKARAERVARNAQRLQDLGLGS